jgi:Leucine-rich repeat (LRR) protein
MNTTSRGVHFSILLLPIVWLCLSTLGGASRAKDLKASCKTTKDDNLVVTKCTGLADETLQTVLQQVAPDTTHLTITDSTLKRLPIGGFNFTNLASVTWILIGPCGIKSVDDGAFFGLQKLVYIFIKGNPFYYVPRTTQWSQQLPLLKELHISGNNVKHLEDNYFNGGTFEVLDLRLNHIEFIEDETFSHSSFIKHLDLSSNWLMTISQGSFYGLKGLVYLDMSNNTEVFDSIYLSEQPFLFLSELEHLNLANTSRKGDLPGTLLTGAQQLKYLNLSGMHIREFPVDVLHPVAYKNLVSLDLSFNTIEQITSAQIKPFSALRELYLRDTRIRGIDVLVFPHLTSLNRLDLSENLYLKLEGLAIHQLMQLEYLNIRGLLMGTISNTFFHGLERLKEVDLSHNNLTQITQECLYPVFLAKVILGDNPWLCDCFMLPLKVWIMAEKLDYDIRCNSPPDVRGKQLKDVNNSTLCRVPLIKDCCQQSIEAYDGSDLTVTCVAWGDPPPVVTWEALSGNPFLENRTIIKDDNQTLVIKDLVMENSGNFSCTALNRMGSTTKVFELMVLQSAVLEYAEIIAIACAGGIVVFTLVWLVCFLMFKQKYFVHKPYVDDDSHEERDYLIRGIQVRVCD